MPSLILATSILLKDQIVWLKDVFKAGFSNLGSGVKVNVLADPRCRVELIDLEKMAWILMSREFLKCYIMELGEEEQEITGQSWLQPGAKRIGGLISLKKS